MAKKWIRITSHIVLASFVLHTSVGIAATPFEDSVAAGTTFATGATTSYTPGTNLDATLTSKGLGSGSTIAPQEFDGVTNASQQSTLSSTYTDVAGAAATPSSSTTAGAFIENSSTRVKIDLSTNPTFGNKCLETDAAGACIKWSTSTDAVMNSYPDCTQATTTTGTDPVYTYVELTEATVNKTDTTYQYQREIYPETAIYTGTVCSSLTPTALSGDQVYSGCKEIIANGTTTSIVETLSLPQKTVSSSSNWVTVYDTSVGGGCSYYSDIVRKSCDGAGTTPAAWETSTTPGWAESEGFFQYLCYDSFSDTTGPGHYRRSDRGLAGISTSTFNNTLFLYGGQLTKITITLDDTGNPSGSKDPQAWWLVEVLDPNLNLVYATDNFKYNGNGNFDGSLVPQPAHSFVPGSTGVHTVRVFRGTWPCITAFGVKIEKLETTYATGASTEPAGMADSMANCTLKSTRAYDNTWSTYLEAINDGTTVASATIPAAGDTRVCQNFAGANNTYNLCLQSVQVSMDMGVTALPSAIETTSPSGSLSACTMRSDTETYTVLCTCGTRGGTAPYGSYPTTSCYNGDWGYDADGWIIQVPCGSDYQITYVMDGDPANDVTCTSTTSSSWETKILPNGLYNWRGEATFVCVVDVTSSYQSYIDQGCSLYSTQCQDTACDNTKYTFKCPTADTGTAGTSTVSYNCGGMTVDCIGDACKSVVTENNTDLASAAASGEVLENAQFDSNEAEVFPGKVMSCQKSPKPCCKATTPDSCDIQCYIAAYKVLSATANYLFYDMALNAAASYLGVTVTIIPETTAISGGVATTSGGATFTGSGGTGTLMYSSQQSTTMYYASTALYYVAWAYTAYTVANMMYEAQFGCTEDDVKTGFSLGYQLCHQTGERCTSEAFGTCLSKENDYCCFSSILARLVQVQGRAQLGIGWDGACRGLTVAEISSLDFSLIDLSEYMQYVKDNTNLTDIDATTYSCPNGGTVSGSNCTQFAAVDGTCPSGWTVNGTRCEQAATITYECPTAGTTLSGTICTYGPGITERNTTNSGDLGTNIETQMSY